MEIFHASVQYNDLKGSVAADRADQVDATKWLRDNGHTSDEEYVLGIRMWAGENHGVHKDPVSVTFLVSELRGYSSIPEMLENNNPVHVREIRVDMSISEFLALFKRFEVTLSNSGLIEGQEYAIEQ